MAKAFCIPKYIAEKLKEAVKNGEWDMKTLWDMSSKDRHNLFTKYVDDATALRMNAGFEKAMISQQQNALVKWAETVFVGKDVKAGKVSKSDIFDRIKKLDEIGYVKGTVEKGGRIDLDEGSKTFLNDLVEESMGVTISAEEMAKLTEMAKSLEQYQNETDEFGLPVDGYWKARREIENYIKSLVPSPKLKVATSLIGRATMLFSLKSPLLNIESNTLFAGVQSFEKRLSRLLTGRTIVPTKSTKKYGLAYWKRANKVMAVHKYDVTRIFDLKSEFKTLGEQKQVHAQGKGVVRKIGRFYEDVVFSKMLSLPDVFYSAYAFQDSASLWSTEIAKSEGFKGQELENRSLEIMKDSTKIEPLTEQGMKVRELAVLDAQHATFTDDTVYSKVGLAIRDVLNTASGNARIGDLVIPFVKTPANVIGAGLDMGGVGLIEGIVMLPKAIKAIKTGDKTIMDKAIRKIIATGLGWTLAYILSQLFKPDDFIGAYPTDKKELEMMYLENATPNSIKINGKWISLDYFGALATPLLGLLYARKYKGDPIGLIFAYANGAKTALSNFPGISETANISDSLSAGTELKYDPEKFKKDIIAGSIDFVRARAVPAFISDFAKMTDKFERETNASKDVLGKLKNSIPLLRETLQVKKNVLGEEVTTEGALYVALFGSRVKTANVGTFVSEISRLDKEGNAPSITDAQYSSPRVKNMAKWLSKEDYDVMIKKYQDEWVGKSLKLIDTNSYKKLPDDEKATELNKIKTDALDSALDKYHYDVLKRRNDRLTE